MEHALKLALVDPKHLEYKELNKSSDGVAKSALSVNMRQLLQDDLPDDVKLKLYTQMQNRFFNVNNTQLESEMLPPINSEVVAVKQKKTRTPVRRKRKARQLSPQWLKF